MPKFGERSARGRSSWGRRVAAAVNFALKLAIVVPLRRGALGRTVRAFFARSRRATACATGLFDADALLGDRPEIAHEAMPACSPPS